MGAGRPKIYNNVEDIERDIDIYFKDCNKRKRPYTMSGLAHALNMDRRSLVNYSNDEKFFLTIKKAREKVEQQLEENALMGKGNSTFTIFNLKNNFGWKDKIEVADNREIEKVEQLLGKLTNEATNDTK